MTSRFELFVGVGMSVCVVSCAGSAATPASTSTPTRSSWQVILTVNSARVDYGIPGIALDGKGNLYLAEFDDDWIYKYTVSGELVAKWGGHGTGPGQLEGPDKLAFDGQGNLYVTEVGTPLKGPARIQKFSPTGKPLAHWGTFGSGPGQFMNPIGIAIDHQGDIYVAEEAKPQVQKLSPLGQPIAQWGSLGSGPGQFNMPYDLALDASGNVYVSEPNPFGPGNDRIQKFSPAGTPLAQWGEPGSGPGQFDNPTGVAVDAKGNVFAVDSGNNRVEELSPTGRFVAQWQGPNCASMFTCKVAVDDQGNMYVSVGNQVLKLVVTMV